MAKSNSRRTQNAGTSQSTRKNKSAAPKATAGTKTKAQPRAAASGASGTSGTSGTSGGSRKPRTNGTARNRAAIIPSQDEIARRAYDIWVANGRPFGQDEQNWREAEEQLRAAAK